MIEKDWLDLANTTLAETARSTRFSRGHAACASTFKIRRATGFAAWKHTGQVRKGHGDIPYIHHPIEVAALLSEVGMESDGELLQAAVLHDTVEDTSTSGHEIDTHFGSTVRSIVLEVSDDKSLIKSERKAAQIAHAPHLSREAKALKLADKICNIFDVAFNTPHDWTAERQLEYFDWAAKVVAGLRGCNEALEALFNDQLQRSRHAVLGAR